MNLKVNGVKNAYVYCIKDNNLIDYTDLSGLREDQFYEYDSITKYLSTDQNLSVIVLDKTKNVIFAGLNVAVDTGSQFGGIIDAVFEFDGSNWFRVYNSSGHIYSIIAYPFTVITDNSEGKVKNIVYDKKGEWINYYSSNYVDYIEGTNKITYTPDNSGLVGKVNDMIVDKNNIKWLGCANNSNALVSYDGINWKTYHADDWGFYTNIKMLMVDDDNCIWIALTSTNGLYRLNPNAVNSVENEQNTPNEFSITGTYPNPFNMSTTIEFNLQKPGTAKLSVYSITGQKVRELAVGKLTAGKHTAVWDGKDANGNAVSSGIYIARLESGNKSAVAKMVMMK